MNLIIHDGDEPTAYTAGTHAGDTLFLRVCRVERGCGRLELGS